MEGLDFDLLLSVFLNLNFYNTLCGLYVLLEFHFGYDRAYQLLLEVHIFITLLLHLSLRLLFFQRFVFVPIKSWQLEVDKCVQHRFPFKIGRAHV